MTGTEEARAEIDRARQAVIDTYRDAMSGPEAHAEWESARFVLHCRIVNYRASEDAQRASQAPDAWRDLDATDACSWCGHRELQHRHPADVDRPGACEASMTGTVMVNSCTPVRCGCTGYDGPSTEGYDVPGATPDY